MENKKKWTEPGSFILAGRIKARDLDFVDKNGIFTGFLSQLSSIAGSACQGESSNCEWEKDLLHSAARALQIGTFLAGVNPAFLFKEVEPVEIVRYVYATEKWKVETDRSEVVLGLFRDLSIDVYDFCHYETGPMAFERLKSVWVGFMLLAFEYASVEEVEGWFYG